MASTNTCRGRAQTRALTAPDTRGQTHGDCQWLDEEEGEESVLGHVRGRNRRDRPPTVGQDESRHRNRKSDSGSQNRTEDGGDERGTRLTGGFAFGRCAAGVRLRLGNDAWRSGALRVSLVHRACTLCAASHPRFSGGCPAGASERVPGRNQNGQCKRGQLPAESQHTSSMQD
jgi:hypothetical protein